MMDGFVKKLSLVLLFVALAAGLSSCGRKGALQSPTAAIETESGTEQPTQETKPDREFILDGLI